MATPHALEKVLSDSPATTLDSQVSPAPSNPSHRGFYHPSLLLRQALAKRTRQRQGKSGPEHSQPLPQNAPPVSSLIGAALSVGAASGFLEMAVQAVQLHVLHRVDWTSLMFNRHAVWLLVMVSTLMTAAITMILTAPALAWAAWQRRRGCSFNRTSWTWGLAGTTLGTLLLLGPLQAIHAGSTQWHPWRSRLAQEFNCGICWSGERSPGSEAVASSA